MENINVIQHMNEIRNVLSYTTNIGFFFGAGTSCAFGLPNIISLTNETREKLNDKNKAEFDKITETIKKMYGFVNVSVEEILNFVRQIREMTNDNKKYSFEGISGDIALELDKNICTAIFDVIKEKEEKTDISDIRKFIAWYDSASRSNYKEIYTTNYDMLMEMAMEANYTPYFDGFTGAYEPFFCPESIDFFHRRGDLTEKWIRLWKIHGSLNWMKKSKKGLNERIIRVGKIDNPINELMIYPSKEKYNLSRKEPFIAYFDRLKKYLEIGELILICSGYSFSDQHVNDIIFNALRRNARLYVIVFCFSDEQVESMEEYATSYMNLCVMGPNKIIKNGVIKNWIYDNSITDINSPLYWDEINKIFLLGDFKKLINFLVENSGHKSIIEEIVNGK